MNFNELREDNKLNSPPEGGSSIANESDGISYGDERDFFRPISLHRVMEA